MYGRRQSTTSRYSPKFLEKINEERVIGLPVRATRFGSLFLFYFIAFSTSITLYFAWIHLKIALAVERFLNLGMLMQCAIVNSSSKRFISATQSNPYIPYHVKPK